MERHRLDAKHQGNPPPQVSALDEHNEKGNVVKLARCNSHDRSTTSESGDSFDVGG